MKIFRIVIVKEKEKLFHKMWKVETARFVFLKKTLYKHLTRPHRNKKHLEKYL